MLSKLEEIFMAFLLGFGGQNSKHGPCCRISTAELPSNDPELVPILLFLQDRTYSDILKCRS